MMPQIPVLEDPKMLDYALQEIQILLGTRLTWLTYVFGKAERKVEMKDGKKVVFPAVFSGGKDYLKVFPDSKIGSFAFFDIEDGSEIISDSKIVSEVKSKISLILFFDYRTVYPDDFEERSIEHVKQQVVEFFRSTTFQFSQIRMEKIYEHATNVYKGYTDREIEDQFTMRPFGVLRVEGFIKYNEKTNCSEMVLPSGIGVMRIQSDFIPD